MDSAEPRYAPLPVFSTGLTKETLLRYGLRPRFPEVLDSSMLKDFINCPSYFYLRHILGLRKKRILGTESSHLDWGTKWHSLLEKYWDTLDPAAALAEIDPWPASLADPTKDKHGRSRERMIKAFFQYIEQWKDDQKNIETIRTEQFFDVMFEGIGVRWAGRIDRIVRRRGKLGVWDYKTTSKMGETFWESYEHSFQLPGYVLAAREFSTEPIREITIDALYTLKASFQLYRRTIPYNDVQLKAWLTNMKRWADLLFWHRDNYLEDPEAWPKNWNECVRYGVCQFSDIHFSPNIQNNYLFQLQEDYTEERWDPRERSFEEV